MTIQHPVLILAGLAALMAVTQPAASQERIPPRAVLDAPTQVTPGQTLTLSGIRSTDQGGTVVRYIWRKITGSGGSMALNRAYQTSTPKYDVRQPANNRLAIGPHRFQLRVVDSSGNQSSPVIRTVTVRDTIRPTAILDAPAQVNQGQALLLRGNRSTDQGGTITRYSWRKTTGTGGTMVTNQTYQTSTPTFTVPQNPNNRLAAGQHRFQLHVTDSSGNQSQAAMRIVTVRVVDNQAPTAVLDAPSTISSGQAVTLRGHRSTDQGGTIVRYRWLKTSGTGGGMVVNQAVQTSSSSYTVPQPSGNPLRLGSHSFRLLVTDSAGNESVPASRTVIVRDTIRPTAILDGPTQVNQGQAIVLRGNRSADQGGGTITRYSWRRNTGTGGTMVTNQTYQTNSSSFTVPQNASNKLAAGQHQFQLQVTDSSGNQSNPAVRNIIVRAVDTQAPTAVLDAPSRVSPGQAIVLRGNRSVDQGGTIVRYSWRKLTGSGGTMQINQRYQTQASRFTVPQSASNKLALGAHNFRLVVTDSAGNESAAATRTVVVADTIRPTAILDGPTQINQGQAIVLRGNRSTDQGGGTIVRYSWRKLTGSGGIMPLNQTAQTNSPSYTVPQNAGNKLAAGQHRFQLQVTDNSGNQSQPAVRIITVIGGDTTPPVARLTGPKNIAMGATLTLSAAGSKDPGGRIASYRWTHVSGKGGTLTAGRTKTTTQPALRLNQSGKRPLLPGTHRYRLVVVDTAGNKSRPANWSLVVKTPAPKRR